MSHTTKIESVVVTDVAALHAAIQELKREGVNCDLLENAKPRAYFQDQQGMGQAPYVIKLHNSKYDVGLYQTDNGAGFEPRCDFWAGEVERQLGGKARAGENADQARLGKFFQHYAVCAAERKAIAQGYATRRNKLEDGTIQLVCTAA